MNQPFTLVPVDAAVLDRLLRSRAHPRESLNDVLRRVLPPCRKEPLPIVAGRAVPQSALRPAPSAAAPSAWASSGLRYAVLGEARAAASAAEAMLGILRELARRRPDLLERLAPRVRGRTRNHVARSRDGVYPRRPDLDHYVVELIPGWFIGMNVANREKEAIVRKACEAAGLVFGRDIRVDFGAG